MWCAFIRKRKVGIGRQTLSPSPPLHLAGMEEQVADPRETAENVMTIFSSFQKTFNTEQDIREVSMHMCAHDHMHDGSMWKHIIDILNTIICTHTSMH